MPNGIITTPLSVEFVETQLLPEYVHLGITKVLKKYKIHPATFFKFLQKHPHLDELYLAMQSARSEVFADDIIDIADNDPDPMRARNRIEARKWVASKFKPGKYGDRIDVNVTETVDIRGALSDARARTLRMLNSVSASPLLANGNSSARTQIEGENT